MSDNEQKILGLLLGIFVADLYCEYRIWHAIYELKTETAELREAAQYFYDFEEI